VTNSYINIKICVKNVQTHILYDNIFFYKLSPLVLGPPLIVATINLAGYSWSIGQLLYLGLFGDVKDVQSTTSSFL